jgi:hypothetical protein
MSVPIQPTLFNPISGVFGNGQVAFYPGSFTATQTYTWTVPPGVGAVRARCFGGGGYDGGAGGGFAMKAIYDLTGVTSVAITVGTASTTSSFGSYVSATGGGNSGGTQGAGTGGDINYSGGLGGGSSYGGGGVANIFGHGGRGSNSFYICGQNNASGGGGPGTQGTWGGNGFLGTGGFYKTNLANLPLLYATSGMDARFSIDFIGTGGGGAYVQNGLNGGGGPYAGGGAGYGGYPGGGGGGGSSSTGAPGLVIVEW